MKEIPLTQGKVALVDDTDYPLVSQYKWHARVSSTGNCVYAQHSFRVDGEPKAIFMHNLIMGFKGIDHKDGNGLHNWRSNLRPATNSQNLMNSPPRKGRRFKGAFNLSKKSFWMATIMLSGKRIYIGCYRSQESAAKAYDTKARELFGEYARLNFPEQSAHTSRN